MSDTPLNCVASNGAHHDFKKCQTCDGTGLTQKQSGPFVLAAFFKCPDCEKGKAKE